MGRLQEEAKRHAAQAGVEREDLEERLDQTERSHQLSLSHQEQLLTQQEQLLTQRKDAVRQLLRETNRYEALGVRVRVRLVLHCADVHCVRVRVRG